MTDFVSKEIRSKIMKSVKSKNTSPELKIRKALFNNGIRYRVNNKNIVGNPDIYFSKIKLAIFIHGCFWHLHDCNNFRMPKTNTEYWFKKLKNNKSRDLQVLSDLKKLGYKTLVLWECEINQTFEKQIKKINDTL